VKHLSSLFLQYLFYLHFSMAYCVKCKRHTETTNLHRRRERYLRSLWKNKDIDIDYRHR